MARLILVCPLDGTSLGATNAAVNWRIVGDLVRDTKVGDHLHIHPDFDLVCSNGHRWRAVGDFRLEREA